MLGWYILVRKRTLGGAIGYSSGKKSSSLNVPPAVWEWAAGCVSTVLVSPR